VSTVDVETTIVSYLTARPSRDVVLAAHHVAYLLTWNCTHLANATMRGTIEAVCRSEGLQPPIICTPMKSHT
jgi:hypothetical protein